MEWICRTTLPEKEGYYLAKTNENKFIIVLWQNDKWWYDENQDRKILFGLKFEFIEYWSVINDNE